MEGVSVVGADILCFNDCSSIEISFSRSTTISCRRLISASKLCTDRSFWVTLRDNEGREGEDIEMELVVPWLEIEALRDLADDSSCESDKDCDTDLYMREISDRPRTHI